MDFILPNSELLLVLRLVHGDDLQAKDKLKQVAAQCCLTAHIHGVCTPAGGEGIRGDTKKGRELAVHQESTEALEIAAVQGKEERRKAREEFAWEWETYTHSPRSHQTVCKRFFFPQENQVVGLLEDLKKTDVKNLGGLREQRSRSCNCLLIS